MATGALGSRRQDIWATAILLAVIMVAVVVFGTRAAFKGLVHPYWSSILMEISQLDQAMGDHRSDAGSFPPCMGNATVESRRERFYAHITRAFPRYKVADFNEDGV